jgi:hypothetical protein
MLVRRTGRATLVVVEAMREAILGATMRAAIVMMVGCEDEKRRWRVWSRYERKRGRVEKSGSELQSYERERERREKGRKLTKHERRVFFV